MRLDFKTHDSTSSSSKDYWLYILWENLVRLLGCARVHHFLPKIFSQWCCTFIKALNNILTWWLRSSIIFFSFRCVFLVISYFHENKKLPANLLYPQQSIFESWNQNLLYPQQSIFESWVCNLLYPQQSIFESWNPNLLYPQQTIFESWVCNLLYPQQSIFESWVCNLLYPQKGFFKTYPGFLTYPGFFKTYPGFFNLPRIF